MKFVSGGHGTSHGPAFHLSLRVLSIFTRSYVVTTISSDILKKYRIEDF